MADKKFNIEFDVAANITPIKGALKELKNNLGNIKIPDTFKKSIESTVMALEKEITNFESATSKGFSNIGDFNKANRSFEKISDLFNKLSIQVRDLKGIDPNKFLPNETLKRTQSLQQAWIKLKQIVDKGMNTEAIEKQNQALEKQKQKLQELQATQSKYQRLKENKESRRSELLEELNGKDEKSGLIKEQERLQKNVRRVENEGKTEGNSLYEGNKQKLEALNRTIAHHREELDKVNSAIAEYDSKLVGATADVDKQSIRVENLTKELEDLENTSQKAPEGIKQFIEELKNRLCIVNLFFSISSSNVFIFSIRFC